MTIWSRVAPSSRDTTAVEATLTRTTWSSPTWLNEFSSASTPWISCAWIMPASTSRTVSGGLPAATFRRETQSATARMPPRLSEGCPHSAASQVSLKSSQRTIAPMSKAAFTGSRTCCVPGTRAPSGTSVPGTIGPRCFVHSGKRRARKPVPSVSMRQSRAVSKASRLSTGRAT